jgi:hypothetical protein
MIVLASLGELEKGCFGRRQFPPSADLTDDRTFLAEASVVVFEKSLFGQTTSL